MQRPLRHHLHEHAHVIDRGDAHGAKERECQYSLGSLVPGEGFLEELVKSISNLQKIFTLN